jgi:CRP/FNR family cyclic AMP-dependent transcriptional regulator
MTMRQALRNADSEKNQEIPARINEKTLFREFDAHTAARLVGLGIEAWFDPGMAIFNEHDESSQVYFITLGSVALEQPGPDRAVRIQTIHEGEFLGWSAILGSETRHFGARALTRVAAITFDGSLLRKSCEDDPRFGYELMRHLLLLVTQRLDATRMLVADVQGRRLDDSTTASESHL